jgi:hypothetical protein
MVASVYVEVPGQLADTLAADACRESGFRRGIDPHTAISAEANLVTIFVARHEIVRFVEHLWAAARGRTADREHDSTVAFEHRGRRVATSLDREGFGDDGPPLKVVHGVTGLLEVLTELDQDQQEAISGSGP